MSQKEVFNVPVHPLLPFPLFLFSAGDLSVLYIVGAGLPPGLLKNLNLSALHD
jgi:hypothetical protein